MIQEGKAVEIINGLDIALGWRIIAPLLRSDWMELGSGHKRHAKIVWRLECTAAKDTLLL